MQGERLRASIPFSGDKASIPLRFFLLPPLLPSPPFLPSSLIHLFSLHWDKVRDEEEKREEREEKEEREGEGRNGGGEEGGRFGLNPSFPKDEEA